MSETAVAEFREMLLAIGRCADRAVPGVGTQVNQKMTSLEQELSQPVTRDVLSKTNLRARTELSEWADRAFSHHQDVERELREIISVVSKAAGSVGARDQKYASEIGELTGRLGAIAEENDLANMRRSIVESTRALKTCVARMTEESKALVSSLTDEVTEYRTRLDEAEKMSRLDPLTELANRRAFEKNLESRIGVGKPFSLIMVDLDDFKEVNDRYGHPAGDDLLKQFAAELKGQFTPVDLVGRFGGDEFVVVTEGSPLEAETRAEKIRKWALGDYKIRQGDQWVKTVLGASIGVASWSAGQTAVDLVASADGAVYRAKKSGDRRRK